MRTRVKNKGSGGEDPEEEEKMHGQKRRRASEAPRARPNGLGASPAKKPRTNRPRIAGKRLPMFLLGDDYERSNSQPYDEFDNVVQAVAQTLADASQNGSGSDAEEPPSPKAKENTKMEESEEEEAGAEAEPKQVKGKSNGFVRRPPSKRIRNQREREREREKKREDEEVRPQRTRVLPTRLKKRKMHDQDALNLLGVLADAIELAPPVLGGDTRELEEDAATILSLQGKPDTKGKQQAVSPRKKKRVSYKPSGEPSTGGGKAEDKAVVYKSQGRTKRISTRRAQKPSEEGEGRKGKQAEQERPHCPHSEHGSHTSAKARALHILNSRKTRLWATQEWFYSAIDQPWFAHNDFVEYLNHAGIGHISSLTRLEWSVIRSSLGKPRRFSAKFMQEERDKLERYRETARASYHELRNDKLGTSLPADLARPLTVGQRVVAIHPTTGELYDGSILTVDRNRCRVQFDSTQLGVEFVRDLDAMPVNPLENMSEKMRKTRVIDYSGSRVGARMMNDRFDRSSHPYATPNQYFLMTLCQRAEMDNVDSVILAKAAASEAVAAVQQAGHGRSSSPDISDVFVDLQYKLDQKEALLMELRRMHDQAQETEPLKKSETFKRDYATVVLQLKQTNVGVKGSLEKLREKNKYQENALAPWHSSPTAGDAACGLGAGSPAEEIALAARKEAKELVSAAVQGACYLKEGEDALSNLGKPPNHGQPANEGTANNKLQGSDKTDSSLQHAGTGTDKPKRQTVVFPASVKALIPTDYITSCVSTVLMIQLCSEKYHVPNPDVAVIFENALSHLRPRSAQNHQLYKEIEQLLDVLKKQVSAEVAFRPNIAPPGECYYK